MGWAKRFVVGMVGVAIAMGTSTAADEKGKKLFKKHCESCHGENGAGNRVKAKTLEIDPELLNLGRAEAAKYSRDELRKILLEGKDKMPAYARKLKPAEVDPVLDHALVLAEACRAKGPK